MAQRDEVEGLLALGATARQATARIGRQAVAEALIPVTDQTRTTATSAGRRRRRWLTAPPRFNRVGQVVSQGGP